MWMQHLLVAYCSGIEVGIDGLPYAREVRPLMPMSRSHDAVVEPETRVNAVLSFMRSHAGCDAQRSVQHQTYRLESVNISTTINTITSPPSSNEVAERRLVAPDTTSPCFLF